MKVKVQLDETSQPVYDGEAKNTYEKGSYTVIYVSDEKVYKYPTKNIWRLVESYA